MKDKKQSLTSTNSQNACDCNKLELVYKQYQRQSELIQVNPKLCFNFEEIPFNIVVKPSIYIVEV